MTEYLDFFSDLFLFKNLDKEDLKKAITEISPELNTFSRSSMIYTPDSYEKKIGFVYSGECEVLRVKEDKTDVSLNILRNGDSFGILAVISKEEFPTSIKALCNSQVFFIKQNHLIHLIKSYPTVAMNVISFLADRINFLNRKIATFSSGSAEEKLARFILSEEKKQKTSAISFNCKKCSEAISCGRATVYRAIDSLSESGYIQYENKKIIILDQQGLERTKK
jgi:CRP-like cAMP-binding protein